MFRLTVFVAIIHSMLTISSVFGYMTTPLTIGNHTKWKRGDIVKLRNNRLLSGAFSTEVLALSCGVQLLNIDDITFPRTEHLVRASTVGKLWKNLTTMEYVSDIVEEVAADTAEYYIKDINSDRGNAYDYLFDTLERQILASEILRSPYSEIKVTINPAFLMTTFKRSIGIDDAEAIIKKLPKEFQGHPDLRRLLIDIRFLKHANSFNGSGSPFDASCKEALEALLSRAIIEVSRESRNRDKIQNLYEDAVTIAAFELIFQGQPDWTTCVDNILYPTLEERLRKSQNIYKEIQRMSRVLLGIRKKRKKNKKKVLTRA